jgi:hypothetical protein
MKHTIDIKEENSATVSRTHRVKVSDIQWIELVECQANTGSAVNLYLIGGNLVHLWHETAVEARRRYDEITRLWRDSITPNT